MPGTCSKVNGHKRYLTPVECERLNGFDDNWTEGMPKRMRYYCMGNALVVDLIRDLAMKIKEIDLQETEENVQINIEI